MAGKISVTPEELEGSAKKIEGKIGSYVNLYQKLYNEVDGMKSSWSGEANQAYARQIDSFRVEFENLKKVLDNYVEFLEKSAKVYKKTEASIKDGAGKLTRGR
ncbi:WXG100 family type VII secretion target [Acetivibrio cellulolyticus]|uniref:WXG100 family type VII secretion target n=1 Tax=Acetivibrio cellulolyticus TaxID=35830 RepID=UPI0001E2D9A4|nr:WXG100 family type VII secretion target [Acetivibrio cellulolyticus]